MSRARAALGAVFAVLICLWAFLGIELVPDEHDTQYHLFAKQGPSFRLFFRNPTTCGVCDLRPPDRLSMEDKEEFARFCRQRFGLSDSSECYAIFAERQRQAQQRLRERAEQTRSSP